MSINNRLSRIEADQCNAAQPRRAATDPRKLDPRDASGMMIGPWPGESATPGQINTFETLRAMDAATMPDPPLPLTFF